MEDYSLLNFCTDFAKAYFGNPQIMTLLAVLLLGIGTTRQLHKIEEKIKNHSERK